MKGTSIVETLVALSILAIIGSAIVLLLVQISSTNNSAKIKNQAISYVDQAMEQVRGFVQLNGWVKLSTTIGCFSNGTLTTSTSCIVTGLARTTCPGSGAFISTPFYRSVKISKSGDQITVIGTVCWQDKGIWYKTENSTYYYDY